MMVVVSLYADLQWTKSSTWVCKEVIEPIIPLVNEGFPPIQVYLGTGETFHIEFSGVIARCEHMATSPLWAQFLRLDSASGCIFFFAYERSEGGWAEAKVVEEGF